jgi:hypothetical protein
MINSSHTHRIIPKPGDHYTSLAGRVILIFSIVHLNDDLIEIQYYDANSGTIQRMSADLFDVFFKSDVYKLV